MCVCMRMYVCTCVQVMALSAKEAVIQFKVELLQELPLEDPLFFAMAHRAGLFPMGFNAIINAQRTRAHKVNYFLNHVIVPGADEYLPKLLEVMKESKVANLKRLADDIQATLQSGICLSICSTYICSRRFIFSIKDYTN